MSHGHLFLPGTVHKTLAELEDMLLKNGVIKESQKLQRVTIENNGVTFHHVEDLTEFPRIFTAKEEEILKTKDLEDLGFSLRAFNRLNKIGIDSLRKLLQYQSTDLIKFRDLGEKAVADIIESLEEIGLKLR